VRKLDKEQTKLITRLLVAAYLLYLSYMVIVNSKDSEQTVLLIIIGAIFLIAGIGFVVFSILKFIKSKDKNND
jgi:predicted permease